MPDLPTLTVTTAQATRIQNAFPGANQAERVAAYRAWLREQIKGHVRHVEEEAVRAQCQAQMDAADAQVESDLGTI
jgi:hypothetical protein